MDNIKWQWSLLKDALERKWHQFKNWYFR